VRYHEHEPLLEDLEDEKLSKEEQAIAWESFQSEGTDRFVVPTLSAPIPSDDTTTTTSTTPKPQRCKPGDHVRQLVRDSMKPGASMLCKVCGDQISWESVRRK
jgi:hypothetical protein